MAAKPRDGAKKSGFAGAKNARDSGEAGFREDDARFFLIL